MKSSFLDRFKPVEVSRENTGADQRTRELDEGEAIDARTAGPRPYRLRSQPTVPVVIILTVGLDGSTVLSAIRALGRNGVPVYLLAKGSCEMISRCRYVSGLTRFRGDPSDDELRGLVDELLREIGTPEEKPLLLFCSENDIRRLASLREFLEQRFRTVPKLEEVLPFMWKENQFPAAERAGFRVSRSTILKSGADLEPCIGTFHFPVIVKSSTRESRGRFPEKVLKCPDPEFLRQHTAPYLDDPGTELLVQEYVDGGDNDIALFLSSCGPGGEVRCCVTGRKKRQFPPEAGLMASGYLEELPHFKQCCIDLCRKFGTRGFVGIEGKFAGGDVDRLYYIEANFRSEAISALAETAGANLVFDLYRAELGLPCEIPDVPRKGSWSNLEFELGTFRILSREGRMSWRDFLRPLPRPAAHAIFAWDDPKPFFWWFLTALRGKIARILGRGR